MPESEIVVVAQQLLDRYPPLGALAGAAAIFAIVLALSLLRWCWDGIEKVRPKRER